MKQELDSGDQTREIRLLSHAEEKQEWCDQCRLLWQKIFGDSDAYMDYYERYKWKENLVLLLCREDEILSMLHLNPYKIMWEGRRFCLHYIVGVCTKEDMRRRGYMGRLLLEAMHLMYRRGEPWTYLMPAAEELYLPYDFVPVYQTIRRIVGCKGKGSEFDRVIPYGEADDGEKRDLVRFVRRCLSEKFSVYTERGESYFAEHAKEAQACGGDVLILGQEGRITGYVQYLSEPGEEAQAEVVEMISESGLESENIRLLCRYLGEERVCLEETCFWPEMDRQGNGCSQKDRAQFAIESEERRCVIMARIVCIEEFLKWVKRPPQWEECVCLEVRDDLIEENNGCWSITFREQDDRENVVERTSQTPDGSYTASQMAELFLAQKALYINELV